MSLPVALECCRHAYLRSRRADDALREPPATNCCSLPAPPGRDASSGPASAWRPLQTEPFGATRSTVDAMAVGESSGCV